MSRAVRWFDEAIDDLISHVEYVAAESPSAARRIGLRIREAGDGLGDFAIGRPGIVPDTYERVLTDIPYTIVYTLDELGDREVISILRVVHQAQQWPPERL
jgi:plasmid stabilization system protein ParE